LGGQRCLALGGQRDLLAGSEMGWGGWGEVRALAPTRKGGWMDGWMEGGKSYMISQMIS
jgi:hypothetical protein